MTHELLVSLESHKNNTDSSLHDEVRAAFPKEDMTPDGELFFSQIISTGHLKWRVVSFSGTGEEIPAGIYIETNLRKDVPTDTTQEFVGQILSEFSEQVAMKKAVKHGFGDCQFCMRPFSMTEMGMCFEVSPSK